MTSKLTYPYMVATAYSGSTLLAMLLDTHPEVASIGEPDNSIGEIMSRNGKDPYLCLCGKPIRRCQFFRQVQERCALSGVELDLHDFRTRFAPNTGRLAKRMIFGVPGRSFRLQTIRDSAVRRIPLYRRHVREVLDRSEVIARAVLEVADKKVFVDGSKEVSRAFHLLAEPTLDLKVIHIVRDVRAFMHSRVKRVQDHFEKGVRHWARTHAAAMRLKDQLPADRHTMLRWEDFCRAPGEALKTLCAFLGVERTDLLSKVNARPHHVIGNNMRLKPVESIRQEQPWRESLTGRQLEACDRIAGELNRSFGYEDFDSRRQTYSTPKPRRQVT